MELNGDRHHNQHHGLGIYWDPEKRKSTAQSMEDISILELERELKDGSFGDFVS